MSKTGGGGCEREGVLVCLGVCLRVCARASACALTDF